MALRKGGTPKFYATLLHSVVTAEQIVQRHVEQARDWKEQRKIGISPPSLSFGDRLHADVQISRQLLLCHTSLHSQPFDIAAYRNLQCSRPPV